MRKRKRRHVLGSSVKQYEDVSILIRLLSPLEVVVSWKLLVFHAPNRLTQHVKPEVDGRLHNKGR